jgi:DNA-binding transcriptional regulator LsrR (DeoR family)
MCRTGRVMAVGGGQEKYEAIRAAVMGGYCNILITDRATGKRLLQEM